MDVGSNIRKYRKDKNMTITKLAELVGSKREYLSTIENGKKAPSFTMIEKIATALEVEINDLISTETESLSPELNKLMNNAKNLHPSVLESLNKMLENMNNNYKLIEKDDKTKYIIDIDKKPLGLSKEEEEEAYQLITRLKELNK